MPPDENKQRVLLRLAERTARIEQGVIDMSKKVDGLCKTIHNGMSERLAVLESTQTTGVSRRRFCIAQLIQIGLLIATLTTFVILHFNGSPPP